MWRRSGRRSGRRMSFRCLASGLLWRLTLFAAGRPAGAAPAPLPTRHATVTPPSRSGNSRRLDCLQGCEEASVKEITAIIRAERWQETREAIEALGISDVFHRRVLGRGRQRGLRYLRRASAAGEGDMPYLPKRTG